jgi:hypothetical protein
MQVNPGYDWHEELHPSPEIVFESSHSALKTSPSPQVYVHKFVEFSKWYPVLHWHL